MGGLPDNWAQQINRVGVRLRPVVSAGRDRTVAAFAARTVAARLRGERYSAIVHGQFTRPRRWTLLINIELQDMRTHFMDVTNELRRMERSGSLVAGGAQTPRARFPHTSDLGVVRLLDDGRPECLPPDAHIH
ncbi:hypothetical protein ACWGII_22880 [Streptomyces sp. NPDC054855]